MNDSNAVARSVYFRNNDFSVGIPTPEVVVSDGSISHNIPEEITDPALARAYGVLLCRAAQELDDDPPDLRLDVRAPF